MKDDSNLGFEQIINAYKDFCNEQNTDCYLFSGTVDHQSADFLIDLIDSSKKNNKVDLILNTFGGNPHAAFRIADYLRTKYQDNFNISIPGYCKSAGTLIAVGANSLKFGEKGELGPLDIQHTKEDEVISTSGLSVGDALYYLETFALQFFEDSLDRILKNEKRLISVKLAGELSASLVGSVLGPIFARIDPARLGEIERSNKIVLEYAQRLGCKLELIIPLITEYVDHGFVINRLEAKKIGFNVIETNETENLFLNLISTQDRFPFEKKILEVTDKNGTAGKTRNVKKNKLQKDSGADSQEEQ